MMNVGGGDHIKKHLEEIERNIELNTKDPILRFGFTQVPNFILEDANISIGAKVTYAMFLKYAWDNDYVFPGQERLASHMGCSERSVRTYIKELEGLKLLEVEQRGLGKTNLYRLNFTVNGKKGRR
jgi:biotin operon repressor